jgi:hypothetical protein
MLRSALLAAFILPFAAPLLANAQQKKVGLAQQSDAWLVGLPLYTPTARSSARLRRSSLLQNNARCAPKWARSWASDRPQSSSRKKRVERKPDRVVIVMTASEVKTFATRQRELKAKR